MGQIRTTPPPRRVNNFEEKQAPDKELIIESSADLDREDEMESGLVVEDIEESQQHLYHQDH